MADSYRLPRDLPPPVQGGADLVGFGPDLAKQREIYRYFPPNSCEMDERCIAADGGWRKLIMFNSTEISNGTRDLHIGPIPYVTSGVVPPPIIDHGDYVFDKCKPTRSFCEECGASSTENGWRSLVRPSIPIDSR